MSHAPHDSEDLFIRRMLTDTGFFCRNVLGMTTDKIGGEEKPGGVRDHGPHQDFVRALDDPDQRLVVALMPRNSYKSSIVRGRIMREILSNPDCTILLCMHDLQQAKERLQTIRDELLENQVIRDIFGNVKGPLWKNDSFITSLRSNKTLLDPTFTCCAREAPKTGGHYNLILMDDIIDSQSSRTTEGIASSIQALRYLMPLRTIGGKICDIGTLYAQEDVHHFLLEQAQWHKVVHSVGYEVVEREDGRLDLTGTNEDFPFLTKDFLMDQMSVMGFNVWMSQYKNRVVGGRAQAFRREQFQGTSWQESMKDLTGYLLVDAAVSKKDEGCFSVLAYCGLDERMRLYILDLQIGHWAPNELIDRLFNMRNRWSGRVSHQAEVMEHGALALVFRSFLERKAREYGLHLNLLMPARGGRSEDHKDQRILKLQPRFAAREVFVVNDFIPRTFIDLGKTKMLWDPEGFEDPQTHLKVPGGELVEQFVRFPVYGKKDIPDAIAQIDEVDPKTGERYCFYRKPSRLALTDATIRRRVGNTGAGGQSSFYRRAAKRLGSRGMP